MSFTTEQINQIVHMYSELLMSRNEIARVLGVADSNGTDNNAVIFRVLQKASVTIRTNGEHRHNMQQRNHEAIQQAIETTYSLPIRQICNIKSCREIADDTGIFYSAVRNFLVAHKYIPRKTSEWAQEVRRSRRTINDDVLKTMYVDEQRTMREIAEAFGITTGAVCIQCKRLGISRTKSAANAVRVSKQTPAQKQAEFEFRSSRSLNMISNAKQKYTNTDIELLFIAWCKLNCVEFIQQFKIPGVRHLYDFYLPLTNTIVETDGDYWHSKTSQAHKDQSTSTQAVAAGFNIIRFLRSDILTSKNKCFDVLLRSAV